MHPSYQLFKHEKKENLLQTACSNVAGFAELLAKFQQKITVSGKSQSTLTNYGRHLAKLAIHFNELLPVPYLHVVFTLPDTLNPLAMYEPKAVYDSLFEAAWQTVACFAKVPKHLGARAGMISVLHT